MHVVPDVIPAIRPSVDVRLDFSSSSTHESDPNYIATAPSTSKIPSKKFAQNLADIAPEDFILPAQVRLIIIRSYRFELVSDLLHSLSSLPR